MPTTQTTSSARPTPSSISPAPDEGGSSRLRDWVMLAKPGITITNMMTAAAGLWLAPIQPDLLGTFAALGGTGLLVAGSGSFNQILERDTDAHMERTSVRPLPAGRMSVNEAALVGSVELIAGALLLGLFTNWPAAILGVLAALIYVLVYTPLKRQSLVAIPLGGVAGAMPPAIGWTAATGTFDLGALALFNVLFWWQMPHFLGISLYRAKDYQNAGLQVAPGPKGYQRTVFWTRAISFITLISVIILPFLMQVGWPFMTLALIGTIGPMAYIVRPVDYTQVHIWGKRVFLSSLISLPLFAIAAGVELIFG